MENEITAIIGQGRRLVHCHLRRNTRSKRLEPNVDDALNSIFKAFAFVADEGLRK